MSFRETARQRGGEEIILDVLQEMSAKLDRIFTLLSTITLTELRTTMDIKDLQAKADNVLSKVTADGDVTNAVKTLVYHQNDLLSSLQGQIRELQSSNDPAALDKLAATIDAIKAAETANADTVAAAVAAGTPADPALPAPPQAPAANPTAAPPDAAQEPDNTPNPEGLGTKPINQPEAPPA